MKFVLMLLVLAGCSYGADPDQSTDFVLTFPAASSVLDPAATLIVERAATAARRASELDLVVAGYTNDPATPQAEQILSRIRAQTVANALVERGVARRRIGLKPRRALGAETEPESRRVEIRIGS